VSRFSIDLMAQSVVLSPEMSMSRKGSWPSLSISMVNLRFCEGLSDSLETSIPTQFFAAR